MTSIQVYNGSDGEATKAFYQRLMKCFPYGEIAMNLFRAQKCSSRAKNYRRRAWKDDAYSRKQWSIDQLCDILIKEGQTNGIVFGWKEDPNVLFGGEDVKVSWVFYVDLPCPYGQVSFHCPSRGKGPAYDGEWDGQKGASEGRVIEFCDYVLTFENLQICE